MFAVKLQPKALAIFVLALTVGLISALAQAAPKRVSPKAMPKQIQNTTPAQCMVVCLKHKATCRSFSYNDRTSSCTLSTRKPAQETVNTYVLSKYVTRTAPRSSQGPCWSQAEKSGALCYKKCKPGYKGVGPVCWQRCPTGYKDDGAFCRAKVIIKKRKSYGRGAGKPMGCSASQERDGALCYPRCKSGYNGVGPVCWQRCPSGFRNDGAYCRKPKAYGRGVGKIGKGSCEKKYGKGKCEKHAGLWYQKCRAGYHNAGCCICSPNCTNGMKDIGVSCQKKSYGRGAGKPLHACGSGREKAGALCYPRCKAGYKGVGPVCWAACPAGYKTDGATCRKPGKVIAKKSYGRGAGYLQRGNYRRIFHRYIRDHYRMYKGTAKPLRTSEKTFLKQFFPADFVDGIRVKELAGMTGTFNHSASATTYGHDLVVIRKGRRSNGLLKHELVHACQYKHLGRKKFAYAYADQYVDDGYSYRAMDFEEDAYDFAAKGSGHIRTYTGVNRRRGAVYATCK